MGSKHLQKRQAGFSLVESLVVIALMGVLLLPLLVLSSSHFLNQLNTTRQNMTVSHNTAQFLNRFMEELYQTPRIISSSSTQLLFGYYDASAQREKKIGYRLTDYGGGTNRILERLVFNDTTGNWDVMSPYSETEAQTILLPNTAVFTYCQDAAVSCTAATSATDALLVRLSGWSFSNSSGSQRLALPDLDAYLSVNTNKVVLGDSIRELYNFSATTSLGSGSNYGLVVLSPKGEYFQRIPAASGTVGSLTTIVSGITWPGRDSMAVAPDGRVFFGQMSSSGRVYTWHPSTGLTTITPFSLNQPGSSRRFPGREIGISDNGGSLDVAPDGRVFFGQNAASGNVYTWHKDTGLTTITPSALAYPGAGALAVTPDGRVYFGQAAAAGNFYTWHKSTGLTIITPTAIDQPGAGSSTIVAPDGRVFFGQNVGGSNFYTYHPSTGLTTIATGKANPGYLSTAVSPDGRVMFCTFLLPGECMTWKANVFTTAAGSINAPGAYSTAVAPDGRFYFGTSWSNPGGFFSWKETTGLTTIISTAAGIDSPGADRTLVAANGRVYFGGNGTTHFYTWHPSTGLTTITPAPLPGVASISRAVAADGRVFFGQGDAAGRVYTWHPSTGLTTITPFTLNNAAKAAIAATPDGRVFFGQESSSANFYTWHKDTGLTTISPTALDYPGYATLQLAPDGRVFFGTSTALYTWTTTTPILTVPEAISTGSPLANNLKFTQIYGTAGAATADANREFFLLNTTNNTLDAYTQFTQSGQDQFKRTNQLTLGAWVANVRAIAADDNNTNIAFMETVNKQIYVYDNRKATSAGAGFPKIYNISTIATNPTGLAINQRTGEYLVIDSTLSGTTGLEKFTLYVLTLNPAGPTATIKHAIPIGAGTWYQSNGYISSVLTGETNLKIQYDSVRNILYLIAPTQNKVYAMTMPKYI